MKEDTVLNLKWHSFPSHLAGSLDTCYEKQQFVDLSLVCKDGTILKCHKMVLANSSTFFQRLLVANDHPHPMIILHDVEADDLKTIINFMYCGEIQVVQSEVRRLLKLAEILEVTGLKQIQTFTLGTESDSNNQESPKKPTTVPRPNAEETKTSPQKNAIEQEDARIKPSRQPYILSSTKFVSTLQMQMQKNLYKITQENLKKAEDKSGNHTMQRVDPGPSGINFVDVNMPSTSKGLPNPPVLKRKDNPEPVVDWPTVLSAISKDNRLPLKKLCIMDEVEITASKPPSQVPTPIRTKNNEPLDRRKMKDTVDGKHTIKCEVFIKDEVDLPTEAEEDGYMDPLQVEESECENTENVAPVQLIPILNLESTRYNNSGLSDFPSKKSSNG